MKTRTKTKDQSRSEGDRSSRGTPRLDINNQARDESVGEMILSHNTIRVKNVRKTKGLFFIDDCKIPFGKNAISKSTISNRYGCWYVENGFI